MQWGNTEIVRFLVSLRAVKLTAAGGDGFTALDWAIECGHGAIVDILRAALAAEHKPQPSLTGAADAAVL